jgi:phosphatidylinositol kinase/protein kinase (PI-3  family)
MCVCGGGQHGTSYRRLTMRGSNGRMYPFLVQHSNQRHARAEERVLQLFRMFNEYARGHLRE